jgi:hypothetical protein
VDIWIVDPVHLIDPITLKGHEKGWDLKRRREDSFEGNPNNPHQPKPRESQHSRYSEQYRSGGRRGEDVEANQ